MSISLFYFQARGVRHRVSWCKPAGQVKYGCKSCRSVVYFVNMKKFIIIFSIIALLVVAFFAVTYIKNVTLPHKIKEILIENLHERTGKIASIDSVRFFPLKGIIVNGLRLYEPDLSKKKIFMEAEEVSFNYIVFPYRGKRLISTINIHNLSFTGAPISADATSDIVYQFDGPELTAKFSAKLNPENTDSFLAGEFAKISGELKIKDGRADIELESGHLTLSSSLSIVDKNAKIENAEISYKNSSVSLTGDIYEISEPDLNVYGDLDIFLEDIFDDDIDMRGRCKGELFIGGKPSMPRLMELGLKLKSDEIKVNAFSAQNLEVKFVTKNQRANLSKFTLDLYGGMLVISSAMDLSRHRIPYEVAGHLRNVQVEKVIMDTKLKDSGIYGNFNSSVKLSGTSGNLKSINGDGWIHIKDAHLGPLPIFIPLVSNLAGLFQKMVPGYEKLKLKEATATLIIADEKVTTHDCTLWGDEASVLYDGSVDFEGNLDFRIENNFAEGLMGNLISESYLRGTIKKPKYEFSPLPVGNFFKGILGDFLQKMRR